MEQAVLVRPSASAKGIWADELCSITYLNTSSFALYLIPTLWRHYRREKEVDKEEQTVWVSGFIQGGQF